MKSIVFAAIVIVAVTATARSQTPVASAVHFQHTIESKHLGETRTILVHVPVRYSRSSARYPVVYMTDAHGALNPMMVGLTEQQAWGGMMPEMIVVGIQNTNRSRDLTPTNDGGGGQVGGAERFLAFIEHEVIPLVEKNYRTHPFRIHAGHSLGGLFAVWAMLTRPDLFNGIIAASPVLQWDKEFVIKRAAEVFKQSTTGKRTLFIAIANEPDYVPAFSSFRELLKKTKPNDLDYEFREFKDENHVSGVLPTYFAGLRKVFEGWPAPQSGSIEDYYAHFDRLSRRFGFPVQIPENDLNRLGYDLLRANRITEAIEAFKRNATAYPESPNVFDSLADGYEKSGQLKLAAENYERSARMAEAAGDQALATASKQKLEKIRERMK